LAKAAELLAGKYTWVVTNVPYLGRGAQCKILADFCEEHYPEGKNDLAMVFLDRCLEFCTTGGSTSIVLPQNWLFLPSYKNYREKLLKKEVWKLIARLGSGAFETISGEVVKAILITLSRENADSSGGLFSINEKKVVEQAKQLDNPDARVALVELDNESFLSELSSSIEGLSTGDGFHFIMKFWEFDSQKQNWVNFIQNADCITHYNGRSDLLWWGNGKLKEFSAAHNFPSVEMNGRKILGQKGVRVTQMSNLPCTIYSGEIFGKSAASIVPFNESDLPAIWCFLSDENYKKQVRKIDQKVYVSCGTLIKIPFNKEYWFNIAVEKYPNGLPQPYTNDPTQWIFHGHPCGSVVWDETAKKTADAGLRIDDTVLHVAMARLLGYRWPAELDADMELAPQQRAWVNKCSELVAFADDDGIACIPAVRGERAAVERLQALLRAAYGTSIDEDALLAACDCAGLTLETWLRDRFFEQHCKLFGHRPFIWQIWDGDPKGFSALINYHTLTKAKLERLTYTYLNEWINQQDAETKRNVAGAETRLVRARALQEKLKLIIKGEKPYDIFVRWKMLKEQPLGWEPDLNDGVRMNIRPFLIAEVLRYNKKPKLNISWDKDRGRDVESAPWFAVHQGERINDWHTTLEEKMRARGLK